MPDGGQTKDGRACSSTIRPPLDPPESDPHPSSDLSASPTSHPLPSLALLPAQAASSLRGLAGPSEGASGPALQHNANG